MLGSGRLVLRELDDDDFDAVHAYASDPEVVQYVGWGPSTEQDTRDFLRQAQMYAAQEPRSSWIWAVVDRNEERLIGSIGLYVDVQDHQAMLGYCYHRDAWGKGFATEAAKTVLDFAFDVLLLHRVWAGCDPDNTASIRVLQKLGMSLEGHLRESARVRGEIRDELVFGILAREWRS